MKKLIFLFIVIGILIGGYSYDQFAWCKKLILGDPTTHTIQKGEYLSRIAQKYYGDASYWRELSLINRAPNSDTVFPGEEIIIPSLEVVKEIRKTRWLSKVNNYMKGQEDILANLQEQPVIEPQAVSEPMATVTVPEKIPSDVDEEIGGGGQPAQQSSSIFIVLSILGVVIIGAVVTLLLYRKKKQNDDIAIIDDIDFTKEESEPDYQEYLKNRKEEKEVLVN